MKACSHCKHSARCLPNQVLFLETLFNEIAQVQLERTCITTGACVAKSFVATCKAQVPIIRELFSAELPYFCPVLSSSTRKHMRVIVNVVEDTVVIEPIWPTLSW